MRRSIVMAILAWAFALGATGPRASDEPRADGSDKAAAPIYVIVEGATDLDSLRNRLNRPDFVILNGSAYDALKTRSRATTSPAEVPRFVVESLVVGGEVLDDLAHLTIDLGISLAGDAATWVPIRMEKAFLATARQADKDLPLRSAEGGWQVQLKGPGKHLVQVTLTSPVMPVAGGLEGRRVSLPIPEAASTRVGVIFGGSSSEIVAHGPLGAREPLAIEGVEAGQKNRASAFLTPRKSLDIAWKVASDPAATGTPLVTAQGEIALDVERGSLRARSSWDVRAERGTLRKLELRIDPADELVGLECDGRPVGGDEPREANSGTIVLPLPEALRPGGSCKLVVTTRRALSPETTVRTTYRGATLLNVVSQTGVLAIAQPGGDPWVSASPGRGLRPIDPRADLPAALRARPSVVLAYQFVEQPFDLGLQIDPSPPWVRVKTRTKVSVDPSRTWVETWLDYTVARGRVFDVKIALPEGYTLDGVGPDSSVSSWESLDGQAGRYLAARLGPTAGSEGDFTIKLSGWQATSTGGSLSVGLPRPIEAQTRGGTLAVLTARGLSADLEPGRGRSKSEFVAAGLDPPPAWARPSELTNSATVPSLWLRHDDAPGAIVLALSPRERTVRAETSIEASLDRRRLDVRQDTTIQVRSGTVNRLDVTVPAEVEGAWEIDGLDVTRREPAGPDRQGRLRYRLFLGREITDTARLRFRLLRVLTPPLDADRPTRLVVPRVEIEGLTSNPTRVRISADEGIDLATEGGGWRDVDDEPGVADASAVPARLERAGDGPAALVATAHATATLPKVVASRLWLRTTRDVDGTLRTSATYRPGRPQRRPRGRAATGCRMGPRDGQRRDGRRDRAHDRGGQGLSPQGAERSDRQGDRGARVPPAPGQGFAGLVFVGRAEIARRGDRAGDLLGSSRALEPRGRRHARGMVGRESLVVADLRLHEVARAVLRGPRSMGLRPVGAVEAGRRSGARGRS